MLKIKTESNNYLAVSTCLEELQESAEAFTHAIDDMSGLVAVEE